MRVSRGAGGDRPPGRVGRDRLDRAGRTDAGRRRCRRCRAAGPGCARGRPWRSSRRTSSAAASPASPGWPAASRASAAAARERRARPPAAAMARTSGVAASRRCSSVGKTARGRPRRNRSPCPQPVAGRPPPPPGFAAAPGPWAGAARLDVQDRQQHLRGLTDQRQLLGLLLRHEARSVTVRAHLRQRVEPFHQRLGSGQRGRQDIDGVGRPVGIRRERRARSPLTRPSGS